MKISRCYQKYHTKQPKFMMSYLCVLIFSCYIILRDNYIVFFAKIQYFYINTTVNTTVNTMTKYINKKIGYSYHLFNVITNAWNKGDHIKRVSLFERYLYFTLCVRTGRRTCPTARCPTASSSP